MEEFKMILVRINFNMRKLLFPMDYSDTAVIIIFSIVVVFSFFILLDIH